MEIIHKFTNLGNPYFRAIFYKLDYPVFEPYIKLLKAQGYNDQLIKVFMEYAVISQQLQNVIKLEDEQLVQIHQCWTNIVKGLSFSRFAGINHLYSPEIRQVQTIYFAVAKSDVKGFDWKEFNNMLAVECSMALHRNETTKRSPIVPHAEVLYDLAGGTPIFQPFVSIDAELIKIY